MGSICQNEAELEDLLATPSEADRAALAELRDLLVLGAGGKMGPSLVRRARRAAAQARILAVARAGFDAGEGIEIIEADLLDRRQVEALPDAQSVIFLAGRKFGSSGNEALTWATNAVLPALVAERYRHARLVVLSSGNVYPLVPAGAAESMPVAPVGEYAQSVLARERIFEYFSARYRTPVALLRLNYAVDLRYGVLVDIARKLLAGELVDVTMGAVNILWQGDANSYILRSLALAESPPRVLNVTGPETLTVRWIARRFGELFGIEPRLEGAEAETALLSDASLCHQLLGPPSIPAEEMIEMTAAWLRAGGATWDKPTHFEVRSGRF